MVYTALLIMLSAAPVEDPLVGDVQEAHSHVKFSIHYNRTVFGNRPLHVFTIKYSSGNWPYTLFYVPVLWSALGLKLCDPVHPKYLFWHNSVIKCGKMFHGKIENHPIDHSVEKDYLNQVTVDG